MKTAKYPAAFSVYYFISSQPNFKQTKVIFVLAAQLFIQILDLLLLSVFQHSRLPPDIYFCLLFHLSYLSFSRNGFGFGAFFKTHAIGQDNKRVTYEEQISFSSHTVHAGVWSNGAFSISWKLYFGSFESDKSS